MALIVDNLKITSTNYGNSGSHWSGVTVYDKITGKMIARVKTTAMYGSLNYLRAHPASKYTLEFIEKLRSLNIDEWKINAILA